MTVGDQIRTFNFHNILETAVFKSKRKYEGPKTGSKRSYNSLELEENGGEQQQQELSESEISEEPEWITIAQRSIKGSTVAYVSPEDLLRLKTDPSVKKDEDGFSFNVKDVLLDVQGQILKISNIQKSRLKKHLLIEMDLQIQDSQVIYHELEFFKPGRIFERSQYVKTVDPIIEIEMVHEESGLKLDFNVKYMIQLKECCIFVHPLRACFHITNLIDSLVDWIPVPYETPYSTDKILKRGYNKISPSSFYSMISDINDNDEKFEELSKQLIIPELDTDLFHFQNTTVNWLLQREGVSYNEHTHTVQDQEFFSKKDTSSEDRIGKCLDLVCFGWSRIQLPFFDSNSGKAKTFWYNKYTGNLTSSKYAAAFLYTIPGVPAQGLLAEEMGLGKTVEILSLILLNQRKSQEIDTKTWDLLSARQVVKVKTTLIICPDSILKQWYQEIHNLAPHLKISIYKGVYSYNKSNQNDINSPSYKSPSQIAKTLSGFDIVLASYQTVAREVHHAFYNPSSRPKRKCAKVSRNKIQTAVEEKDDDGNIIEPQKQEYDDYEERSDYSSPLMLLQFWRIILDEVQMVSNKISNAAKIAKIIPRYHSWGVSGTPIRKDLNDLHSFLVFSHLHPFNDGLSAPKANRLVWSKLTDDSTIPIHFIRLFKNIALRHTKRMVSDEIKLPPQKRVLFTTDFTPVERNLYDHMFEQFLTTVSLNDKGDPLVDDWEPNSTILSYMREWLIKLRQACCHSQIGSGSIVRGANKGDEEMHLRTVDAVLDMLIADNENSVVSNERKLLMAKIEKGQIYEAYKDPKNALTHWEQCLPIVNNRITYFRDEYLKWEREIEKKLNVSCSKEEELFLLDKLSQLKTRTRSWLEVLHRLYFFIASAHYQSYTPPEEQNVTIDVELAPIEKKEIPDEELSPEALLHRKIEEEYYDKAELLRRELLSDSIGKVNKMVQQVELNDLYQYQIPVIKNSKLQFTGMEIILFFNKYTTLIKELNDQAQVLNEWFAELSKLLSKKLKDDPNGEGEGPDDDYEESLVTQDAAYAYLEVLQNAVKDRNDSLTGISDQSAVTGLIQKKDEDDDIFIFKTGSERSELHKELEAKRKSVRPQATFIPEMSLRSMILKSKDMLDSMIGSGSPSSQYQQLSDLAVELKTTLNIQKKNLNNVKKEYFGQLNDLYNVRIEYYKSLQALSDNVKGYDMSSLSYRGTWSFETDEEYRHRQIDRRIQELQTTQKSVTIRNKYLQSLKNAGSRESEEERLCIICQSAIVNGVLTTCGHQYCKECLGEWLRQNRKSCPMCKAYLDQDSLYNFTYTRSNLKGSLMTGEDEEHKKNKNTSNIAHSIYQPIEEEDVKKIEQVELFRSYGSKIDLIIKVTKHLLNTEDGVQIVVFSQWSELLFLIGLALKNNNIKFLNSSDSLRSNTGSGKRAKRIADVDIFKKNKHITCFLLNAKAQASGLTLVNASHVFLCEPLVNTALELQAISRIHRIGQKKPTTVWMFVIGDTVEESIMKLSTKKRLEYLDEAKKHELEESEDNNGNSVSVTDSMNFNDEEIDTVNAQELTKTVEGLVDKKLYGGEVVSNDELWSSFFS